jgi:copper(I)-binding protein
MKFALTAASLVLAVAAAPAALAAPQVSAAWSRPAVQGSTGVGYMTLDNPGAADALVAVQSPASGMVMIHRAAIVNGVSSMSMVERVPLPKGARVTFAPGGYHLMFTNLTRPLAQGQRLPATLVFASGARVQTSFVVGLAPPAAGHPAH